MVAITPCPLPVLRAALHNDQSVGGELWNGMVVTRFRDRHIIHMDAVAATAGGAVQSVLLPLRFVFLCIFFVESHISS